MALNDPAGVAWGRWLQRSALRWLTRLLIRFEVVGLENIPLSGPVILIINHIAFLDPVIVIDVIPRRVVPLAKIEAFDLPVLGLFMKIYGTIPVRRHQTDLRAIKHALQGLKNGSAILIAPEGTRSHNRQLQPARDGATMLALHSGAPIVPIGITGTDQMKAHLQQLKKTPIRISVGEPFRVTSPSSLKRLSRGEISQLTTEMMQQLAAQLPPEYRGVYEPVEI